MRRVAVIAIGVAVLLHEGTVIYVTTGGTAPLVAGTDFRGFLGTRKAKPHNGKPPSVQLGKYPQATPDVGYCTMSCVE